MNARYTPIVFALSICSLDARAGEPIATDRPDFVESSAVVGKGRFQVETSLNVERTDSGGGVRTTQYSTPTLLRMGLSPRWEGRVESDGRLCLRTQDNGAKSTDCGYADVSAGLKWHASDPEDNVLGASTAWLFHVDLPSGSGAFRAEAYRPSVRAVAEWELRDDYSMGVMAGWVRDVNDAGRRFNGGIFAIVLGKALNEQARVFIEYAGQSLTGSGNGGPVATLDMGLAYLVGDDMQVDVVMNRGLNGHTPDLSLGAGFSIRF